MVQPLKSMAVPQRITSRFTPWSRNSTLEPVFRRTESRVVKRYLYTHVQGSIIHNGQNVEATHVSTHWWWAHQGWYKDTLEHYAALKRKEILPQATPWRNLEDPVLSEISRPKKKDKYYLIPLIWSAQSRCHTHTKWGPGWGAWRGGLNGDSFCFTRGKKFCGWMVVIFTQQCTWSPWTVHEKTVARVNFVPFKCILPVLKILWLLRRASEK